MLGQHSEIAFAGEFQWIFEYSGVEPPADMNQYYRWLEKDRFFQIHQPTVDRSLAFPELLRSVLREMKSAVTATKPLVIVSMHRHYEAVRRIWPNARFIHLVRDGRDVASSWMKFGWHGNTWSCGHEWIARLDEWEQLRTSLSDHQYFALRFEDLIDDPPLQLQKLCRHFGLAYQPEMLEYHRHSTYAPITNSRIRQWSKKLSKQDLRVLETIAGTHLVANGYELSGGPHADLSAIYVSYLRVQNKLRRIRSRIRDHGFWLWITELITRRAGLDRLHDAALRRMYAITNSRLE